MYYMIVVVLIYIILIVVIIRGSKKNKMLFNKIHRYEDIINEQGMINHEYNNQLMVISGYIQCNNYSKANDYLKEIIDEHRTGQNYEIRQLSKFPDGGLKTLLYYKFEKIESNNIKYSFYYNNEIKRILKKMNIKMYKDITKLTGIFIDNAIDYLKNIDEKKIDISMNITTKYLIIEISNTIKDDVDISSFYKKGFTTKGKGHGFGLQIVKSIIKSNAKLDVTTDIDNDCLVQTILVDLK